MSLRFIRLSMAMTTATACLLSPLYKTPTRRSSPCESSSAPNSTVSEEQKGLITKLGTQFIKEAIDVEESEGTEEWEKEKSGCSFCQHFLQSPCKTQFTRWSKCVDKSKDLGMDYVNTCAEYTDALMSCTSDNDAYFALKQKEMEEKNGRDPEQ